MIGGSTIIGDNVYVAPSVSIRDQLTIGSNSFIGMSASLLKSIHERETWAGNPAKELGELKRLQKALQKLVESPKE